jgi:hypothetical protein
MPLQATERTKEVQPEYEIDYPVTMPAEAVSTPAAKTSSSNSPFISIN